jgi:murein DD-endopeptidase MepM/ murein hydrolase activator NlpD
MQVRDDSLYRSVFGLDPIPVTVREVGLGGSNPYPLLLGFNTSDIMISTTLGLDKLERKAGVQQRSFADLFGRALERKHLLANKPFIQPIPLDVFFYISSDFGSREDPINNEYAIHKGIDFAARVGTEVFATGEGTVLLTKISGSGYGKEILIDHGFGYTTRYAHLNTILVHMGQKVHRGSLIGTLGNSGKSTGPHLHYEVRLYNNALNPNLFYADDLLPDEYRKIVAQANPVDN